MAAADQEELHTELADFLERTVEYEPTVPEAVCRYYMQCGGVRLDERDSNLLKLVALATDHFLSGVVYDAGEFATLRSGKKTKCLRIADVTLALERRGVTSLHAATDDQPDDQRRKRPRDETANEPPAKRPAS